MKNKYYIFKQNLFVMNILLLILLFLMFYLTNLIDKSFFDPFLTNLTPSELLTIWIYYILIAILHEIIHGIFYIFGGASPKKVIFGMEIEKSIFYCLCKQDIRNNAAKKATIAPFIYIGILTYIIGILFHFPILTILSIINISGCVGDLVVYTFLCKLDKNTWFSEFDDSTSFAILSSDNPIKHKTFGLKYLGEKKQIDRKDLKRIKISKFSFIFLILMILGILIIKFLEI